MTQDCCLCFPLHVRSDMVAIKVPPGSLTGWRIKIFLNNVGRILLFAVLHRYLTVKSEQGQYWRNEPRNLAGSWRCGFLLTVCEIFGLASWVFSGLVMDAAAGRLLWDILFGWSLSIHVHSCTISLVYNIICWIFLVGSIAKMEISFRNNSTLRFLFTSYVLLLQSYSFFFCFEGTLACLDVFFTCTYLFLSMELQLQLEAIERKRVFTALVTTFVILQFASSPFESCGGIGASILRYICRYVQRVHLRLCSFASS